MNVKYCKSCKTEHPLTKEFWYKKRDNEFSLCVIRAKERRKNWAKNNRDKINKYKRKNDYKYKQSPNGRYSFLKKECQRRKKTLEISKEEYILFITDKKCYYCDGDLPKNGTGLDRIDPEFGYNLDNVVACCYSCNKIKNDSISFKEMIEVAKLLKTLRSHDASKNSKTK